MGSSWVSKELKVFTLISFLFSLSLVVSPLFFSPLYFLFFYSGQIGRVSIIPVTYQGSVRFVLWVAGLERQRGSALRQRTNRVTCYRVKVSAPPPHPFQPLALFIELPSVTPDEFNVSFYTIPSFFHTALSCSFFCVYALFSKVSNLCIIHDFTWNYYNLCKQQDIWSHSLLPVCCVAVWRLSQLHYGIAYVTGTSSTKHTSTVCLILYMIFYRS